MSDDFGAQHVTIHGHDVDYRRGGAAALLLVHGLAGSSRTWKDVMPALAQTHDVIAPDLLGHDNTARLGHSFGGGVAMQVAYQHPEM